MGGFVLGAGLLGMELAVLADATIGNATPVELGTVVAVAGGVWYLGRALQRLEDRQAKSDDMAAVWRKSMEHEMREVRSKLGLTEKKTDR